MKISKPVKWTISIVGILLLAISTYIYWGLNALDVEDRYGDLQNFYWNGKDGDIVLNNINKDFGILEKEKNRIYVFNGNKKLEIEEFLEYKDEANDFWGFNAELYRSKNKIDIRNMNENLLNQKIHNKELELIEKVDVKY